jgi:hypothetical protein
MMALRSRRTILFSWRKAIFDIDTDILVLRYIFLILFELLELFEYLLRTSELARLFVHNYRPTVRGVVIPVRQRSIENLLGSSMSKFELETREIDDSVKEALAAVLELLPGIELTSEAIYDPTFSVRVSLI